MRKYIKHDTPFNSEIVNSNQAPAVIIYLDYYDLYLYLSYTNIPPCSVSSARTGLHLATIYEVLWSRVC